MATPGIEVADNNPPFEEEVELTEVEKENLREELKKTETEINTLRQLLAARQKHVANLKRKLGISPLNEITTEVTQGLRTVKETPMYQKTNELVSGTAETVANKWADMRNSSIFKSFESKLGSAYNNARMAASTSIDQLAGAARGAPGTSGGPASGNNGSASHTTSPNSGAPLS